MTSGGNEVATVFAPAFAELGAAAVGIFGQGRVHDRLRQLRVHLTAGREPTNILGGVVAVQFAEFAVHVTALAMHAGA
jgi:hypothetical protein